MFINFIVVLLLMIGSIKDIRKKKLSYEYLIAGFAIVLLYQVIVSQKIPGQHIIGLSLGIIMLIVSRVTKEAIGYGDSILFGMIGLSNGFVEGVAVLCISFAICSVYCGFMLVIRKISRDKKIAFVPFIFLAYTAVYILKLGGMILVY